MSSTAKQIDAALTKIRRQIAQGVVDAAGDIRKQAVLKTPVDTGNLRKTAEIFVDGNLNKSQIATPRARVVAVRYSAPYSRYVHDASGRGRGKPRPKPHRGKYWDPIGAEPQFLRKSYNAVVPHLRVYITRRIKQVYHNA